MTRCLALAAFALLLAAVGIAQTPDWQRLPGIASMSTRALDFDRTRERMVMFESSGFGRVSRTWEWVDEAWSLRRTVSTPPPRDRFAFACDPVRRRCVLFGGTVSYYYNQPGALLADTWEFDGIDWRQLAPPQSPPAQCDGWMGYDHAQGALLLCGGASATGNPGASRFDGVTWTPAGWQPFLTHNTSLASDPLRRRIVAVTDGVNPAGVQTLEWDGFAWQTMQLAAQPPPGLGNMTFVTSRGTVVLHRSSYYGPNPYSASLWEYAGATWNQIAGPAPLRLGSTMAHDPTRNRTFTLTADQPNAAHQTWIWDGTSWTAHNDGLGWEQLQFVAFDYNRQRVVAVTNHPLHCVEWDGQRWHVSPAPPQAYACSGLAFDQARGRLVAIGSDTSSPAVTWEHDGTSWGLAGAGPTAASPWALLWHGARGRVMLVSPAGLYDWTGTAWLAVGSGPGTMWSSAIYDAARGEIAVPQWSWGGPAGLVWEVQVWNGTSWQTRVPATSPPHRIFGSFQTIGYDEARQCVVVFGGRDPVTGSLPWDFYRFLDDLWEWNGTDWSRRLLANTPPAREAAALVFDPVRQHLLLLGGYRQEHNGAYKMFGDVWALEAATAATVTALGAGCAGASGTPTLVPSVPHAGASAFTLDLHGAGPAAPVLFVLAFANARAPLGPACTSFVPAPDQIRFAVANAAGFTSTSSPIPLAAQGLAFTAQAAVLDPTAALGFAATAGQRITVGRAP